MTWDCKIDNSEIVTAGYPELHIGKNPEDNIIQVQGNLQGIGNDTLRILGAEMQLSPRNNLMEFQVLDDGDPIQFEWVGVLLDNTMHKVENVILRTTFPQGGPIVTIKASKGGNTLTIEVLCGECRFQIIDHDVIDILIDRKVQNLRKMA